MDDWLEISLRIGLAALAGVLLGANRWLHHKSAGVKTHALVAIGAALATLMVMPLPIDLESDDVQNLTVDAASRVIQGLITGVGFLGAGVIIHNAKGKRIQGLTTAASIWITTLIGAAFGMGQIMLGVIAVVAVVLVLLTGNLIEQIVGKRFSDSANAAREEDQP